MADIVHKKNSLLDRIGRFLADRLKSETSGYEPYTPSDPETLARILRPGDILLVEGNQKISAAIKYLTQSTWSHAAMFVGDAACEAADESDTGARDADPEDTETGEAAKSDRLRLVEVNLGEGCVAVPLSKYASYNTRICRPVGLTPDDRDAVVSAMVAHLGVQYDLKHIFDLMRYFLPTPPVPVRVRRRMIAFGSGDPTRAICSSLIAETFQAIRYPILPEIRQSASQSSAASLYSRREILHIRNHTLFAPRDFDLSPYFKIVKPTLEYGFDYKALNWNENDSTAANGRPQGKISREEAR